MEPTNNRNIDAVKRFIESQIRPGEKYDYDVLQKKFDITFAKKENTSLRGYRLTLEMINKGYLRISLGKDCGISDYHIEKLREFIDKYRRLQRIIVDTKFKQSAPKEKVPVFKPSSSNSSKEVHKNAFPVSERFGVRLISGIPMRGNYSPEEAPTDEFGCVLVCDNDE